MNAEAGTMAPSMWYVNKAVTSSSLAEIAFPTGVEAHSVNASFVGARTVTFFRDSKLATRSGYLLARLNKVDSSVSAVSAFTTD